MRMSNFETALHLLPSFLVVVRKFQILTSTPFFRTVWKETSFVASRGRAGGEEEERRGGGGHGGVKERYERVERKEEEEVEVEEEVMRRRRWMSDQQEEERGGGLGSLVQVVATMVVTWRGE